jgi:hypothetical protein
MYSWSKEIDFAMLPGAGSTVYITLQQVILHICTIAIGFTTFREANLYQARKFIRKLVGQCLLVISSAVTESLDTDADINFYSELIVLYPIYVYSSPTIPKN